MLMSWWTRGSLAEQLALSFLWSDPDDPAADPLSLSPRYRPVLARLPLHLVFTLSVNKTDLPVNAAYLFVVLIHVPSFVVLLALSVLYRH